MDIKNIPNTEKYFEVLNKVCDDVLNENIYVHDRDWSQDEINLFISQFNNAYEEEPIVDMNKLDPHFIPFEDFSNKYSGFDEETTRILWECENKKLEDARIPPLRVKHQKVNISNNLSDVNILEDASSESQSEARCETNRENRDRGFEDEEEEEEASV